MGIYLPYIVLAVVVLVFFLICWFLFGEKSGKKKVSSKTTSMMVPAKKKTNKKEVKKVVPIKRTSIGKAKEESSKETLAKPLVTKKRADKKAKVVKGSINANQILADLNSAKHETKTFNESETITRAEVEGVTTVATSKPQDVNANSQNQDVLAVSEPKEDLDMTRVIARKPTMESVRTSSDNGDLADDATQMIPIVNEDSITNSTPVGTETPAPSLKDETRVINVKEVQEAIASAAEENMPLGAVAAASAAVAAPVLHNQLHIDSAAGSIEETANIAVKRATSHFMQAFGILGESSRQHVEEITAEALQRLEIKEKEEIDNLLENIVVQEALFCMQKAYVSTPTEWMRETALTAFLDVVQQPKSSTPYLVAFDALRILPHLTLGHFQIMALVLLLQYSRNSNNYTLEHFRHYVEKYIDPFLSDLPLDESMYRQLDYLRCCVQNESPNTLAQVLSASYPFVFNYRGFTMDELTRAMGGERLGPQFVVNSLNSSMKKLAIVDESMATRLFRMAKINDGEIRRKLLGLMVSKPTSFSGSESLTIMEAISPTLADFNDVYNQTLLNRTSLTLLGLYLARAHVKVTIGEEFDLSRWF